MEPAGAKFLSHIIYGLLTCNTEQKCKFLWKGRTPNRIIRFEWHDVKLESVLENLRPDKSHCFNFQISFYLADCNNSFEKDV